MTVQPSLLFVFGLGFTGAPLAHAMRARGWQVRGTVRSETGAALRAAGVEAEVWPGPQNLQIPPGAHWLISVPPGADGCPVAHVFGTQAPDAASVTYLSTTGVYGDLNGGWAFETSPLNPQSARARARVQAENQWLGLTGGAVRRVRLPGIYGPGRSALDRLRNGDRTQVIKPEQVFSRIHVDDLVSGLAALLDRPQLSGVFHFTDDLPASPEDVACEAARLLGLPAPKLIPFEAASLSPMAASFYAECKRVSNARAKAALGWRPGWPNYHAGLAAILAEERTQNAK